MSTPPPPDFGPAAVARLGRPLAPRSAEAPILCTLVYVQGGVGHLRADGIETPLAAGDVVVLAPNASIDERGLSTLEGYLVDVGECVLGRTWTDADPTIIASVHFLSRWRAGEPAEYGPVVRLSPEERVEWDGRLGRVARELAGRAPGYADVVRAELAVLLIDYARRVAELRGDRGRASRRPLVGDVLRFIDANYHRPIALADVAKAVGRSRAYLTQLVRRETGRTVGEWIQVRRMTEARRLLQTTDRDGADVARAVSFTDPSYFIRLFQRYHGATPAEWRAAHRLDGVPPKYTRTRAPRGRSDRSADRVTT